MKLDDITLDLVKTVWLRLPSSHPSDLIETNLDTAKAMVQHLIGYPLSELSENEVPLAIGAIQHLVVHLHYNLEPIGGHPISPTFTFFIRELKAWVV